MFESYDGFPNFQVLEVKEFNHRWPYAIYHRLPLRLKRRTPLEAASRAFSARLGDVLASHVDLLYVPYVPSAVFPRPNVPTVYSMHDIQQVHYPQFFTDSELQEREVAFARCVEHATVIQASSRFMFNDFCKHFAKLDQSNVEVIPEGVDIGLFSTRHPDSDVTKRYGLPQSFLFLPAQLWHHKNHITLLRALSRLNERGLVLPLVLTGAQYNASEDVFKFIEKNELDGQVLYLGVVPFDDVIALYQHARFLVMPSLYESSSIPILEAAAAGTPIIAGRIPPNEEFAEHLEMRLFAPTDDAELARVIEEAWDDEETSRAQVAANRGGVQRYSWDNAARMYLQLFERLQARESVLAGERP